MIHDKDISSSNETADWLTFICNNSAKILFLHLQDFDLICKFLEELQVQNIFSK